MSQLGRSLYATIVNIVATDRATFIQFLRYGIIGLSRSSIGYMVYLTLTHYGTDPKAAMSMLFVVGVSISFFLNRRWTFVHTGSIVASSIRFGAVFSVGYLINLGILYVFVDIYGFAHQFVQLAAMATLVLYFFVTLKIFVFKEITQ